MMMTIDVPILLFVLWQAQILILGLIVIKGDSR